MSLGSGSWPLKESIPSPSTIKNLGSKHSSGSFEAKDTQALGSTFIPEAETKSFF